MTPKFVDNFRPKSPDESNEPQPDSSLPHVTSLTERRLAQLPPDTRPLRSSLEVYDQLLLPDILVAAVVNGAKTSTSSLLTEYVGPDDPLPLVGMRSVMVDSSLRPLGILEITEVRMVPISEIELGFVMEEGEGYESFVA